MRIGNLQINPEAAYELGKEAFIASLRGKIDTDINDAWKQVEKAANPGKVTLKKKPLKNGAS